MAVAAPETTTPEGWVHSPQHDGSGCSWCGAFAQVNAEGECVDCFEPEETVKCRECPFESESLLDLEIHEKKEHGA